MKIQNITNSNIMSQSFKSKKTNINEPNNDITKNVPKKIIAASAAISAIAIGGIIAKGNIGALTKIKVNAKNAIENSEKVQQGAKETLSAAREKFKNADEIIKNFLGNYKLGKETREVGELTQQFSIKKEGLGSLSTLTMDEFNKEGNLIRRITTDYSKAPVSIEEFVEGDKKSNLYRFVNGEMTVAQGVSKAQNETYSIDNLISQNSKKQLVVAKNITNVKDKDRILRQHDADSVLSFKDGALKTAQKGVSVDLDAKEIKQTSKQKIFFETKDDKTFDSKVILNFDRNAKEQKEIKLN